MNFKEFIGSFFGTGYMIRTMPGTSSSTILWALLLAFEFILDIHLTIEVAIVFATITYILGIYSISGFQALDPKDFTLDEAFAIFPLFALTSDYITISILTLIVFRIFDITKIFGIKKLETYTKKHRVISIYIDDLLAGIYTYIVVIIYKFIYLKYLSLI